MRLFKNFNFATANVMMFILGVLLFSSLVMMPQFLQTALGIHGRKCRAGSFGQRLCRADGNAHRRPAYRKIPGQIHHRLGWLALAVGMYVSTVRLDLLISFRSAAVLRVMQAVRAWLSVRSNHAGGLHRDAAGKVQ